MNTQEYARDNILQSLENAITYASYIYTDDGLRHEIMEMTERYKKRIEKKFKDYSRTAEN